MGDIHHLALASRREVPCPLDFDASLARFNLSLPGLRPHRKNPIARSKLEPGYVDPLAGYPPADRELPLIGEELSGQSEKEAKSYVPKGFPTFPSIHTYRYTPEYVEKFTVRGNGLKYNDGAAVPNRGQVLPDGPRGDPKKIREAAAKEAQQAEEALRGLVRASKINALRELRTVAEQDQLSKERYGLWETAMREMMVDLGTDTGKAPEGPAAGRVEIADHSMMVNSQKTFHRRELQRGGKKTSQKT